MSHSEGRTPSSRRQLGRTVILLLLIVNGVVLLLPWAIRTVGNSRLDLGPHADASNTRVLGVVQDRRLRPLDRDVLPARLSRMGMQEARSPESAELDLGAYEGSVVVVEGHDGGGWIYSARVTDVIQSPLGAQLLRFGWLMRP